MTEVVLPRKISSILLELTSRVDLDSALISTITDAIEHRMEKCDEEIRKFETKYGMKFEEFKEKWEKNKLPEDRYSYNVEKDYWEWEAAISRRTHLEGIREKWIQ